MRGKVQVAGCVALLLTSVSYGQEKPPTPEKKALSAETFLELRSVQDPQFSPDGTRVAFVVSDPLTGEKRTSHIWLYDKQTDKSRQLTFSDKSEKSPRWSPDSKQLAFLSNRGEQQQIYLLRMEGGEAAVLTKGKANVDAFEWSPDGQSIAYLSANPKTEAEEKKEKDKDDARVVDRDTKYARLRVMELAKREERALTDSTWKVEELQWLPNGQSIVIKATDRPASDRFTDRIYLVNAKDRSKQELQAPRGPFHALRVSLDGLAVSFVGSRDDGPEPHDLQLISTQGGVAKNLTGASLDRAIVDYHFAKGGWIVLVYADGFHRKFAGYNGQGERKDPTIEISVNAGQFSVSAAGDIAFVGENATTMPELWLRDTQAVAKQVSHVNDAWKDYGLVAPEFFKYKSFDGTEIEAGLLKPAGYDGKTKLPLVVLVHGGPTGNWANTLEPWGQLLVAAGYAVLYPNVRGSIGYGQKFVEMNRADWGGGDFKDVMAGVDDLIAKGIADPERLGIGGWSYGGFMSEWAITQTTRFKAAVSGAGMADLISEFGTEEGPYYDEWFWGVPYEKPEGFLNSSPFLYVKNAKTPTLILQGESDPIDPIGQSQELYRGLKRYGVDAELVLYPREPHGFQEAKHRVDVQKRIVAWFQKYLKTDGTKNGTEQAAK
jgi:dipeptidyl aminopeptidase/acylaminoacyl peptidase